MSKKLLDDLFDSKDVAQRRDEVIRRMANTPPQPKTPNPHPKKKTKAAGDRAVRKAPARREG